jgi:hypothetical protein
MNELIVGSIVIKLAASEILLEEDFSHANALDEWLTVGDISSKAKSGMLDIKHKENGKLNHGQLFSKRKFSGDILMKFTASAVPPSDHDIIWWWGVKLNKEKDNWEHGYLGALGGWWANQAGIEKIEAEKAYMAKTPLFRLESGRNYKIHCGIIKNNVFFFVDEKLIMEFIDPDPLTRKGPGHIGFGIYQSHIKISGLKVYNPKWEHETATY